MLPPNPRGPQSQGELLGGSVCGYRTVHAPGALPTARRETEYGQPPAGRAREEIQIAIPRSGKGLKYPEHRSAIPRRLHRAPRVPLKPISRKGQRTRGRRGRDSACTGPWRHTGLVSRHRTREPADAARRAGPSHSPRRGSWRGSARSTAAALLWQSQRWGLTVARSATARSPLRLRYSAADAFRSTYRLLAGRQRRPLAPAVATRRTAAARRQLPASRSTCRPPG